MLKPSLLIFFVLHLPPHPHPAIDGCPRSVLTYIDPTRGYVNLALNNEVLCVEDIERWARMLNASDVQQHFMLVQHERFIADYNEVSDRIVPEYLAKSNEASEINSARGMSAPEFVRATSSLNRLAESLRSQFVTMEHAYIDSIGPILTDDQQRLLDTLRKESVRRHHRSSHHPVRWSGTELRPLWMDLDRDALAPEVLAQADAILTQYESALTPLVQRQSDAFWTRFPRTCRLLAEAEAGLIPSREQYITRLEKINRRFADASQRTAQLTEDAFNRLIQLLDTAHAAQFTALVKQEVFPELYPDPHALHARLAELESDQALDEQARAAILSMSQSYTAAYEALTRELEAICIDWGVHNARGEQGYSNQYLPEVLQPVLEQRAELSDRWSEQLAQVIPN